MTFTPAEREALIDAIAERIRAGLNDGHSPCEDCGDVAELRPYGKDGANVCFPCGMKDEEEAKRQFFKSFGILPQ